MVVSFDELVNKYKNYANPSGKISREIREGRYFPIVRGFYETSGDVDGIYLAGYICGPSYVSFDTALAHYDLIPEAIFNVVTSATFGKNKRKQYNTQFGFFLYRDVPKEVYSLGVKIVEENGYAYQIATPEKAVCDKLYTMPTVHSIKQLKLMLFEDLRIDDTMFWELNMQDMATLAPLYKSVNLKLLSKLIERRK